MPERRPVAPPLPTHDALTGHAFTMDLAAVKAAAARTAGRLHITPLLSSIGAAEALRGNEDVKEFYLGLSTAGRKSFRDNKFYRRRKRWLS